MIDLKNGFREKKIDVWCLKTNSSPGYQRRICRFSASKILCLILKC